MPARFFRFPRGSSICLTARVEKTSENEKNVVVCALNQVAGEVQRAEVCLLTEGRFLFIIFIINNEKLTRIRRLCATWAVFTCFV